MFREMGERGFPFQGDEVIAHLIDVAVCADESGIHGSAKVCIVAGYIGSVKQWCWFETDWEAILRRFDVRDFHSKEFFAFDPEGRRAGHYRRLSDPSVKCRYGDWTDEKCDEFVGALLDVIERRNVLPLGAMIQTADFWALRYGERRFLTGGNLDGNRWLSSGAPTKPYFLLFQHCLVEAGQRTKSGKRTLFIFDQQKQYESRALETFNESYAGLIVARNPIVRRLVGLVFHERSDAPGLQAADLYVHCWHRYATQEDQLGPQRYAAMEALTSKRAGMLRYTAQHLEMMLGHLPPEIRHMLRELPDPSDSSRYGGPNFERELIEARAALSAPEPASPPAGKENK